MEECIRSIAPGRIRVRHDALKDAELAERVRGFLETKEGVRSASVDFMKQRLSLECDDEETLEKVKRVASNFEEVKVIEEPLRAAKPNVWKTYRADILCIAFSAALLLATFFIPERYSVALYVLYARPSCGRP